MPLIIIFGTTGITMTMERGQFFCPHCQTRCGHRRKRVRRFFTLYFIPLIPLDLMGEYIECDSCEGTYHVNVLNYDPGQQELSAQALFMIAMKQVMIAMLLSDGSIADAEIQELQVTFRELAGVEISEEDLRQEIAVIQGEGTTALELVQRLAPGLTDQGKELVLTAAYQIACADGVVAEDEQRFLEALGRTLQLSSAHLRGILAELAQPRLESDASKSQA